MAKTEKLLSMSRIAPKKEEYDGMDSVKYSRPDGKRRAFDVLMEAQLYWNQMEYFRRDRQRNKRYTYGKQWDDIINVDGVNMTEEQYIKSQGNVPLKNNLIRRLVRNVIGVYRGQSKEPTCVARDRDEHKIGEAMSTLLQYNMQVNKMNGVLARCVEEYLISGLAALRKSYGWKDGRCDCWTDFIDYRLFFIDSNMKDPRGFDVSMVGEIHDISLGELLNQFANTPDDYHRLTEIYRHASNKASILTFAEQFGYSELSNVDFLHCRDSGRCRVIEVWRKEQKPRYRCHDYQNGEIFKIDIEDYDKEVRAVNEERLALAASVGMPKEEVPIIEASWFIDNYWYYYYLSPFGDILQEGETPYEHGSHPYVFKAYPFIDGEIHSFVSDVIDQQRYTNRLITMYDWIMRASAKGMLMIPEDCLPDGMSIEDIAENWAKFNGVILYKPSKSGQIPQQVANNSVNIGIHELLNIQLKFFEEISGVNGALQGKTGYSGTSAALYSQQTQNATTSLLDILDTFSEFVVDGAYKDVKNIQQFYDEKRIINIVGKKGSGLHFESSKIRDAEFDLSITESTSTPVYRQYANDFLMQLWQAQAITVEQLLEHGNFPFADDLLQSILSQKEQMQQGQVPGGIPPELLQQAQQGADPRAMGMINRMAQ